MSSLETILPVNNISRPTTPDGNVLVFEHPMDFFGGREFIWGEGGVGADWEDAPFCHKKLLSPEEAQKKYDWYYRELDYYDYQQVFEEVYPLLGEGRRVTEVVTLGLGSPTKEIIVKRNPNPKSAFKDIENAELVNDSMYQLALVMKFVDLLEQKGNTIERVYMQDPNFTPADVAYFDTLGFEVNIGETVTKPLTNSTFLFAIGMVFTGMAEPLEDAFPAMYVGGDLPGYAEAIRGLSRDDPDNFQLQMKHRKGEDVIEEFHDATTGSPFTSRWNTMIGPHQVLRVLKYANTNP